MALGLGSCVGVCLFDSVGKVAGMAHVVLPECGASHKDGQPGKFANTAIESLLLQMTRIGASQRHIKAAIAGGAHVFNFGTESPDKLDIGDRNTLAVSAQLKIFKIPVVAKDCGGNTGRTVLLHAKTGVVMVRLAGQPARELADLGDPEQWKMQKAA